MAQSGALNNTRNTVDIATVKSRLDAGTASAWTQQAAQLNGGAWYSIAYGNGVFVAVTYTIAACVMRSTDYGVTWTAVTPPQANQWNSVTFGNGVFVAVASSGTNRTMRSTDNGLTWTAVVATALSSWTDVAFGNGFFVAVSTAGLVMRSLDNGLSWFPGVPLTANPWSSIAHSANGVFVAVASTGTNKVMRSTNNGQNWTDILVANADWQYVTYGNGVFVAISATQAYSMRSTDDGVTWSSANNFAPTGFWGKPNYGNNVFIVVSSSGTNRIARSFDGGVTWDTIPAPVVYGLLSVAFGNNTFVIGGDNASINNIFRTTLPF